LCLFHSIIPIDDKDRFTKVNDDNRETGIPALDKLLARKYDAGGREGEGSNEQPGSKKWSDQESGSSAIFPGSIMAYIVHAWKEELVPVHRLPEDSCVDKLAIVLKE